VTCVLAVFLLIVILQSSTVVLAQSSDSTPPRTLGTPTRGYWTGNLGALPSLVPEEALAKAEYTGSLPSSFSWSGWDGVHTIGTNYMTPVRNQGGCGSCWAFAAIGGMEAQYQINRGNPSTGIDLSEQNLLQCSGGSCSGYYMSGTLNFLRSSGTPDEACNPYNAADHPCGTGRCSDYLSRTYKITGWTHISTTTNTIKYYLYTHGPVIVYMPVFDDFPWYDADFWQYSFYGHGPTGDFGGHLVVIVGWNDAGDPDGYWVVRNSWGTSGGDVNDYGGGSHGGYFYMTMNPTNGFFGIYQEAAVISSVTSPGPTYQASILDKSVAPDPSGVDQGSKMTFTVTVQNTGANDMSSARVQLKILKPDGRVGSSPSKTITRFLAGSTRTIQITYNLPKSAATGDWTYGVYVYRSSTLLDSETDGGFKVRVPSGVIVSLADSPDPVAPGGTATFTVKIKNTGNLVWSNAKITIKILKPDGKLAKTLTINARNIQPGIEYTYTKDWRVPSTAPLGTYTYNVYLKYGATTLDQQKPAGTIQIT